MLYNVRRGVTERGYITKSITVRINDELYQKLIETNADMNKNVSEFVIKPHITKSAIIKFALEGFINQYWSTK